MGLFSKLFGKAEKKPAQADTSQINELLQKQNERFQMLAAGKTPDAPLTEAYLIQTFAEKIAPHKEWYMAQGTPQGDAYFKTLNAAREEMIADQALFREATKWTTEQLTKLVNEPKPGVTNMVICGLIYQMGNFAVIKDAVWCVDFSTRIPHCIALYLLLTAQEMPKKQRSMLLDAGDGVDKRPLTEAMDAVSVCDPSWKYQIY